ncbi:MAG: YtxH domain-containing protein [bacterium]
MYDNQGSSQHGGAGVVLAFLVGGVVGAGIALLVAPRTGADTRREIGAAASRAGVKVRDGVGEIAGKVRDNVEHMTDKVRDNVEDVAAKVRTNVDEWKNRPENRVAGAANSPK